MAKVGLVALGVAAGLGGAAAAAFGHGGGHATPWPAPSTFPYPSPARDWPRPLGPGEIPPKPASDAPSPAAPPRSGPVCGPGDPAPQPTGTRAEQVAAKEQWTEWFQMNRWRFLPGPASSTFTGDAPAERATVDLADHIQRQMLPDRHFDPRSAAAITLGKLGALGSRDALEHLLVGAGEHGYVRESAALGLGLMRSSGSRVLLLDVARDPSYEVRLRVHAVIGLGLLEDTTSVEPLCELLGQGQPLELRVAAAMGLGAIGGAEAALRLVDLVRGASEDGALRAAAATGLGKSGVATVGKEDVFALLKRTLLVDREREVRRAAALALRRFEHLDSRATLERAANCDCDAVTRAFAMATLADVVGGDRATGEERHRVRRLCELQLAISGPGSHVEFGYAALGLGLLGRHDPECALPLRTGLREQRDPESRAACAVGLGLMRDLVSVPELIALAQQGDGPPELRGYACLALGLIGTRDPAALPCLIEVVEKCSVPAVKAAAATALAYIGRHPEVLATLRRQLRDRNRYFQMSVVMALGHLRDPAAVGALIQHYKGESNPESRALCIVALGCIGEASPPRLLALTSDFNFLAALPDLPAIDQILRLF